MSMMKSQKISLIQGERVVFALFLQDDDGHPFDLTSFNQFSLSLPKTDGSILTITQAGVDPASKIILFPGTDAEVGKLEVTISQTDTVLLKIAEKQDIQLLLNNSGTPNPRKVIFADVLDVLKSIGP